jgi:hypothetical protein
MLQSDSLQSTAHTVQGVSPLLTMKETMLLVLGATIALRDVKRHCCACNMPFKCTPRLCQAALVSISITLLENASQAWQGADRSRLLMCMQARARVGSSETI